MVYKSKKGRGELSRKRKKMELAMDLSSVKRKNEKRGEARW